MMSNEYRFKDNSENMDGLRKLVLFGADKEKSYNTKWRNLFQI